MQSIAYPDFEKVEMHYGRILRVEDFPKALKPAYKLWIDFGELGVRQSSAQLSGLYSKTDLLNRLGVAVVNFPPRQVADFPSKMLVLGADLEVPFGQRIY